jgi:integrase
MENAGSTQKKPRKRRLEGPGSVFPVNIKKADGTVQLRYRAELQRTDANGTPTRLSMQFSSDSAAWNQIRLWQVDIAAKGYAEKQRAARGPRFGEYAKAWLAGRKPGISNNTYRQYEGNLRTRLLPAFEDRFIKSIIRDDVSAFISEFNSLRDDGARKGEDGKATRRQCLALLAQILRDAVDDGIISSLPFRTTGSRGIHVKVNKREMVFLDEMQQRGFLKAVSGDRLEVLFVVALAGGLRNGEVLGLKWSAVSTEGITIVRRLDARSRTGEKPKSKTSKRTVALDSITLGHLEAHKQRMKGEGLGIGHSDLVFQSTTGTPLDASNLDDRQFKKFIVSAKLPTEMRFHDLRHSHAALLLNNGVNVKVVQERLGHESIQTTIDDYGHLFPNAQEPAVALVRQRLYRGLSLISSLTTRKKTPSKPPARKKKALTA